MRTCTKCQTARPLDRFKRRSDAPHKLRSQCRDCDADYIAVWRVENRERARASQAAYRAAHKKPPRRSSSPELQQALKLAGQARYRDRHRSKIRADGRAYEARNRERILERKRKHYATARGKLVRQTTRLRRIARVAGAEGSFTAAEFRAKCEAMGWRCYLCGCALTPKTVVMEHRVPLARGGSNRIENVAPSCKPCNLAKWTRTDVEYLAQKQERIELVLAGKPLPLFPEPTIGDVAREVLG